MKIANPRRARHVGVVGVFAGLGVALAVASGGLASAAPAPVHHRAGPAARPDGMNRSTYDLMLAQIPLDKAANQIQLLAAKPGPGHNGFFETQVNDVTHSVTLVWHGAVPADIMRLVTRLRSTVTVRIVRARYSLAVLNQKIRQALHSHDVLAGYPLNSGAGIHLDVRKSAPAMAAAARSRLGIPVRASLSGGERLQATCTFNPSDTAGPGHRCYDISPDFWGGAVIQSQYAGCTAGFGVHNSAGGLYMMTAAHCAWTPSGYENGVTFYNGNKTYTMGQITDVPGTHDGAIIPTSAGHRYYDGPGIFGGDSSFTKAVAGQQGTSVGDMLCESGSFGGVVCAMRVTALNYSDGTWNSMALAASLGGTYSIDGDSGGPWFSLAGTSSVYAKGIHHGITVDGNGNPTGEIFTPISVLSSDMGVTVNTGS